MACGGQELKANSRQQVPNSISLCSIVPYHQKLLSEQSPAYMGLADVHQYWPSKTALHETDCAIMVGGRLDNQMNFGNPPLFPETAELICVNGSHEEIDFNRAADHLLLSDPGAFLDALLALKPAGKMATVERLDRRKSRAPR